MRPMQTDSSWSKVGVVLCSSIRGDGVGVAFSVVCEYIYTKSVLLKPYTPHTVYCALL